MFLQYVVLYCGHTHTPVVRCAHLLFRWTYWVSDTLKSHDRLYTQNTASAGTAPQPPIPETHIPHCHQPHLPVYQIGACQENKQRYWTQILTQQCIYAIIYQMSKCSQCKCELYIHTVGNAQLFVFFEHVMAECELSIQNDSCVYFLYIHCTKNDVCCNILPPTDRVY